LKGDAASETVSINNLDDYARFRNAIENCTRIAIIGPGLIGCEFANDLHNAGKHVTLIGPDFIPLARLLPTEAGNALRDALKRIGIEWRLGVFVEEMDFNGNGYRLQLSDTTYVDTDIVLSAIGLRPNIRLAQTAGLRTNRGIVVDRNLSTSIDKIYALGDCMEVAGLVLPFVMPIMHCARTLARTLAQQPTRLSYPAMPVVVKTPAHPVIVSPPPPGASGDWHTSSDEQGVRAEFRDDKSQLLGFALTGAATRDRQSLTSKLPPLLA
jgi:rubredoxin-NAD+ reductase